MTVSITKSVGRNGVNRKGDTRKIQQLLGAIFPLHPVLIDGECSAVVIRRIERFQRRFMNNPDARVDPGGRTLRRLNAAAPSRQPDWGGDSSKWAEAKKLASLDPRMRPKVEVVLADLKTQGFKPRIVYAWRSVEVQHQLVEQGHSRVRFSFHTAQTADGTPNAYAADIIDRRWAWDDAAEANGFWDALGAIAKSQDLLWGGDWQSFRDVAHVQFFPNRMLTQIKRESGLTA